MIVALSTGAAIDFLTFSHVSFFGCLHDSYGSDTHVKYIAARSHDKSIRYCQFCLLSLQSCAMNAARVWGNHPSAEDVHILCYRILYPFLRYVRSATAGGSVFLRSVLYRHKRTKTMSNSNRYRWDSRKSSIGDSVTLHECGFSLLINRW